MKSYGYCRVSTNQQADHGQSLDVQQRQIDAYATLNDLTVTQTFVEGGVSGSKLLAQRPAGSDMLAALEDGDVVISSKLDRMFRNSSDALATADLFQRRHIGLHLIDLGGDVCGNGIGRLFFTIIAACANFERDRTCERIREVKADQKKRGCYRGGEVPFGYRLHEGNLIHHPSEQLALNSIRRMRTSGASLREISANMADQGIKISRMGVSRALQATIPS